ncbi:MAG: YraN family protein [Chitinophagaceae bacterium]
MSGTAPHIQTGQLGEHLAAAHFSQFGFTIVERNWRFRRREVDIIAHKGDIIHFIEVKTRTSTKYGLPETAVSPQKMNFLKDAAEAYQVQFPQWKKVQFDVVAIVLHLNKIKEIHVNWDVYF